MKCHGTVAHEHKHYSSHRITAIGILHHASYDNTPA